MDDLPGKHREYRLCETYRKGSVSYALFEGEHEVSLDCVPELAGLKPVEFDGGFIMAVPLKFYDSPKFSGRGKAIYESKLDDFDALDEVISQWWDAIRAGRVKKYIPRDLVPTDPKTGKIMRMNDFGSEYIVTESASGENDTSKIEMVQPEIRYEAFLSSYLAALDMCLQGIVSPATLGIDVGKGAAQRHSGKKGRHRLYAQYDNGRARKVLPQLIRVILTTYDLMRGEAPGVYNPSVGFGEYGAPSFDARVETVNQAAAAATMSIETQVDQMWGNSKDAEWKAAEVARIKALRGIEELSEPSIGGGLRDKLPTEAVVV